MSQPFLGEIRMFGFTFAPTGWLMCNGQTLAISQYAALYSLLGVTYGGNGQTTFQLPNLQGQVPIHQGTGGGGTYVQGETAGSPNVTLLANNMPIHNHLVNAVTATTSNVGSPSGAYPSADLVVAGKGEQVTVTNYSTAAPSAQMNPNTIATAGGSLPHNNMQPYLVVNFCIAMSGIFPTRG